MHRLITPLIILFWSLVACTAFSTNVSWAAAPGVVIGTGGAYVSRCDNKPVGRKVKVRREVVHHYYLELYLVPCNQYAFLAWK